MLKLSALCKKISSVHSSFNATSRTHLAQGPLKHTILSTGTVYTQQKLRKIKETLTAAAQFAVQLLCQLVAFT